MKIVVVSKKNQHQITCSIRVPAAANVLSLIFCIPSDPTIFPFPHATTSSPSQTKSQSLSLKHRHSPNR
jgi:hypothetical protein